MKLQITSLLCLILLTMTAQGQEPDWSKINARPTPQWWRDAKFGIFIHWGPYSVPAFSKVGEYSEWYWMALEEPTRSDHEVVRAFHDKNYGSDFAYADFVPKFTCELFDPDQWANIFERSGAKYIVLTSKHHDGYALWPSKQANATWGRSWNSVDSGPHRDLLGGLTTAVRKTDVKMGIYYSLYEWFNPLYLADVDRYVDEHVIPQFKDVVERYQPSVIFSDGEWEHTAATWRSTEMLEWLFTEAACRNEVVVNDRWGRETRHKHGGYYTTEYGSGLPNAEKPWEECRGMAHSFGYSRTENLDDYNTAQEFVYMLIDIVSRGGNFLLDIGPTADGRIPVIMQERLLQIGEWLAVNGEAIYGTTTWDRDCQWTDGEIPNTERGEYKTGFDIMQLTVEPDAGFARKEVFFTRNESALFAICPVFPDDGLVIKDLMLPAGATITLLGVEGELDWEQSGADLHVSVPRLNPSRMPCDYAYTFKISGI